MRLRNRVPAQLALLAIFAALLGTLAACGSGPTAPRAAPDAQQVFTIDEKGPKGSDLVRLDPQQLYYTAEIQIAKEIFVGLLTLDQNGTVTPDGASAMPSVSADGLTYTFTIRSGLAWSDGTPITAQDFADAIARSQDPCINNGRPALINYYLGGVTNELLVGAQAEEATKCSSPAALPASSPIEGTGKAVEASDATTLVLRISKPAPYFLAALTTTLTMPVPRQVVATGSFTWSQEKLCQQPGMGSGPFKCVSWTRAVRSPDGAYTPGRVQLVRNDRYYGGKAKLREIDYRFYATDDAASADFEGGQANLVTSPVTNGDPYDTEAPPGARQTARIAVDYLQPNWKLPPFDNLDARIAFDAATDRVALLKSASTANSANYAAAQPTLNYIVSGLPGYNPNLQTSWGDRASDPQALHGNLTAAHMHMTKYVAAACHGDITRCPPVSVGGCDGNHTDMEPLVRMWEAAFPDYPLIAQEGTFRCGLINDASSYQLPPARWTMDYPADEDWYDSLLTPKAGQNATSINVPQADALVAQANSATEARTAEGLYRQAEQLYVNQVAWIVLDQPLDTYVVSTNVVGYGENGAGYIAPATLLSLYIAG